MGKEDSTIDNIEIRKYPLKLITIKCKEIGKPRQSVQASGQV